MRHGLKQSKNLLKDWCQWWCKMAEDVLSCKLPFHNLVANILFNNQLHEEDIAIKNIWKKAVNRYFKRFIFTIPAKPGFSMLIISMIFTIGQRSVL